MKILVVPIGVDKARVMNPPQFCDGNYSGFYSSETKVGMTRKGSLNPIPQPHDDYKALVEHKIIKSTARTERTNKAAPASQAYKLAAESGYHGMPNNNGSTTIKGVYKPGAQRGKVR